MPTLTPTVTHSPAQFVGMLLQYADIVDPLTTGMLTHSEARTQASIRQHTSAYVSISKAF
jgi:hypothetical protein